VTSDILINILNLRAKNIKIGKKTIGYQQPTYVIAEAGVNHNGNINIALEMIKKAELSGADAIKFQTFKAPQVCLPQTQTAQYQKNNTGRANQIDLLKKLELKDSDYPKLISKAKSLGIEFLSTPHGHIDSVKFLKNLGISAYKIGSGDITNIPLLKYLSKQNLPIILSTGMATIPEIKKALSCFKKNKQLAVLHCITAYPTPIEEANISAIFDLYKNFPEVLIGYSDHTICEEAILTAVSYGASIIETHFTLDKKLAGPDQKASFNPQELKNLISKIRIIEKIIGTGFKKPHAYELKTAEIVRKSITTYQQIKKGDLLSEKNLTIKRPSINGIPPDLWIKIIGKKAGKDIPKNVQLKKGDWVD